MAVYTEITLENLLKILNQYSIGNLIEFSGIKEVYQYPLFQKKKQHITETPKKFLKEKFNLDINEDPEVEIDDAFISKSIEKFQISKNEINILLGVGGSGSTKRIPSKTFLEVIDKILKIKKCKFFLATGKNSEEQIILNDGSATRVPLPVKPSRYLSITY